MAITSSAKKAIRVAVRRRVFNRRRQEAMGEAIKSVAKLVKARELQAAADKLSLAYQAIDKAAKRGVIKTRTAARRKSRLAVLIRRAV